VEDSGDIPERWPRRGLLPEQVDEPRNQRRTGTESAAPGEHGSGGCREWERRRAVKSAAASFKTLGSLPAMPMGAKSDRIHHGELMQFSAVDVGAELEGAVQPGEVTSAGSDVAAPGEVEEFAGCAVDAANCCLFPGEAA
jgi:hypothetical protein